ncbi:hypothetical protein [Limoniibacter endophyticus]|uniref:hypothetical protein n=1 Tax=Limoniibacter endophyticus TaxID=1565040 RepID=UPI00361E0CBC
MTSSSARIDFSRPTKSGTIICGKTTMSRSGSTANTPFSWEGMTLVIVQPFSRIRKRPDAHFVCGPGTPAQSACRSQVARMGSDP